MQHGLHTAAVLSSVPGRLHLQQDVLASGSDTQRARIPLQPRQVDQFFDHGFVDFASTALCQRLLNAGKCRAQLSASIFGDGREVHLKPSVRKNPAYQGTPGSAVRVDAAPHTSANLVNRLHCTLALRFARYRSACLTRQRFTHHAASAHSTATAVRSAVILQPRAHPAPPSSFRSGTVRLRSPAGAARRSLTPELQPLGCLRTNSIP